MSAVDHDYNAILDRIVALQEEEKLLAKKQTPIPSHPNVPANFSVDLGSVRMRVEFEALVS